MFNSICRSPLHQQNQRILIKHGMTHINLDFRNPCLAGALLELTNKITTTWILIVDIPMRSLTFDAVNHGVLLGKAELRAIKGVGLKPLKSYLTDGEQN